MKCKSLPAGFGNPDFQLKGRMAKSSAEMHFFQLGFEEASTPLHSPWLDSKGLWVDIMNNHKFVVL